MRANYLFIVLSFFCVTQSVNADPVHIAAAANLQSVLSKSLIPVFTKQTEISVVPTFGATKLLATQLENGAPFDVFIAADTKTVNQLAAKKLVLPQTEHVYAIGRLVLWSRHDASDHPKHLEDLSDLKYATIAIANPKLAPYGLAAQQSFAHANMTASVSTRLVQAENITQTLQYAKSGNADVALTALSLVINDKADPYVIIPDAYHAPIAQSLAVTTSSHNAAANQFAAFLLSPQAAVIWKQYGYELPGKTH